MLSFPWNSYNNNSLRIVVAQCRESYNWLTDVCSWSYDTKIFIYEGCAKDAGVERASSDPHGLTLIPSRKTYKLPPKKFKCVQNQQLPIQHGREATAFLYYLTSVKRKSTDLNKNTFHVFLQGNPFHEIGLFPQTHAKMYMTRLSPKTTFASLSGRSIETSRLKICV